MTQIASDNFIESGSSHSSSQPIAADSTAHSFVQVESALPPKDYCFIQALEAIVTSGGNELILRLLEHADSLQDIMQMECHTMLVPTEEAFLNLGPDACAQLETEDGKPHLAAIFRHNLFAHQILLQPNGESVMVDGLDRGALFDVCSLNNHATPHRFLADAANHGLTVKDEFSAAEVD